MKLKIIQLIIVFSLTVGQLLAQASFEPHGARRDVFMKSLQGKNPSDYITNLSEWRSLKRKQVQQGIDNLPDELKKTYLASADESLAYRWEALPAWGALEFERSGDRKIYEDQIRLRRSVLKRLIIGELISRQGKFLPQILNGLWATLEESTWVEPAHITKNNVGKGLQSPEKPFLDLMSGETTAFVAWIHLLFENDFNKISPVISERIRYELLKRSIKPYLDVNFDWMGFSSPAVNNWNIWINTNMLTAVLFTVDDKETFDKTVMKLMDSSDKFVNYYRDDGGCDEGPTYWGFAGGKLIEFVDSLQESSNNRLDYSGAKIVHNIGSYIAKVHISEERFVNFADALGKYYPPTASVWKYGEIYRDDELKKFASYIFKIKTERNPFDRDDFFTVFVNELIVRDEMIKTPAVAPASTANWLADLQILTLREKNSAGKGLYVAMKGGNNDESHNHNDIGNFILYVDGKPAIIDAGVGTYTKQTFSENRYALWNTQSDWHNCPTINGIQQKDGAKFKAKNVKFSEAPAQDTFSLDIGEAYPAEAAVNSWQRNFLFSLQTGNLTLEEKFNLREWKAPSRLNFLTPLIVKELQPGQIVLSESGGKNLLKLEYDAKLFALEVEPKPLDDQRFIGVWGKSLNRIKLIQKGKDLTGQHIFRFSKAD